MNQKGNSEPKCTITEMKILSERFKSRFEQAEETTSKLENMTIKRTKRGIERRKLKQENPRDLWDTKKGTNIKTLLVSQRRRERKGKDII